LHFQPGDKMSNRSKKQKISEPKIKPVQFNLTPQGFLIKSTNNQETVEFFDSKITGYEHQMRSMDPDYAYSIALGKIQVVLDEVTVHNRRPISCKAGCSACCHQKVDITPFEGALIQKHVAENKIEFDAQRLEVQTKALKNGHGAYERLPFGDRRCIFLSSDQKCSIYSVRPLMCRRHFVQSDPAICKTEEFSRIELDVNPDVDAYLSAYVTRNVTTSLQEFIQANEIGSPRSPDK
jgi:Fe-S-cluster containining protein